MRQEKSHVRRMHARGKQRVKEAVTCLKLTGHNPKLGFLLDLGCGAGYLNEHFLKLGIEAVGVEVSRKTIKQAKKNVPRGTFVLADGVKLPFREECFNTIILNDVLEHVPYSLANPMLKEVRRTLKVTGRVYISVANKYQIHEPHTLIPFLTWFPRPCWNSIHKIVKKRPMTKTYYPYTVSMLKRLCQEARFSCKNYTRVYTWNKISNIKYIGSPTVRKIAKAIRKLKLSNQVSFIAEKVSIILFVCTK